MSYERAATATLWAQRLDGSLDVAVARGFLRGYIAGGGVVEQDDVAALPIWLSGVTWWAEKNVQIAIARPSTQHDQLAAGLVETLARGRAAVRDHQLFLTTAMSGL